MPILRSLVRDVIVQALFEETRVARYVVLPDSVRGVTAPGTAPGVIGSEWAPRFNAPGLVTGAHAVIFFGTQAKTEAARFSVRLSRSSEHLMTGTLSDMEVHSWHQIIPPNVLRELDNELIFAVYEGGKMTFSDVAILYTSDKLTITVPPVFTST